MKRATVHRGLPKPFLKWVGGKGQLLHELQLRLASLPKGGRYHEPFVGGGALFFERFRNGELGRKKARLSDNNINLIEAYWGVQQEVEGVIELLREHQRCHNKEYYYGMRATIPETLVGRAARIIYLNKTCFNGLYRENSKGLFNVPMGDYKSPLICDEATLRASSTALKRAEIEQRSFETVLEAAAPGDVVYFDPPYYPISETASFNGYHKGSFTAEQQLALRDVFVQLGKAGVYALLSNSWAPFILEAYELPGLKIHEVAANRAVNSRAERRGKVAEALVDNFALVRKSGKA